MSLADRERLAAELKRAFAVAQGGVRAAWPEAIVRSEPQAPSASFRGISFTPPLLEAVLRGDKCVTRRPMRPPSYRPGDRLWVREKWARRGDGTFVYARDGAVHGERPRWIASRYMPCEAARVILEVTQVVSQRLGAIRDEDARREGWPGPAETLLSPRDWFLAVWDAIYGDGEFASGRDPWVWVIDFRLRS